MGIDDDEDLGRRVVKHGWLSLLRKHLGFSRMLMAEMLYTTIGVYSGWEQNRDINLRPENARRVGRFYREATTQLQHLEDEGVDIATLVPWHLAAAHFSVGTEVLLARYRAGDVAAMDLGILGLWMNKSDLT